MTFRHPVRFISASAIILAGALFCVRLLSSAFDPSTVTSSHPVISLCAALLIAGIAWFFLLIIFRQTEFTTKSALACLLLLGVVLRVMFFGSQPIYENDYKRYLWDGAVTAAGSNPYTYSPRDVFEASRPGATSVPELATLAVMSNQADGLTAQINSPVLTTIYPPVAQAVFASAHVIAPYDLNGLRSVFLFLELIGLGVLLLALRQFNLPLIWSVLYWLNPIIILTTYNGIHMDVLLVLPMLCAVLAVKKRPLVAATALSFAAAIKIWPLLLAPVLFRGWRSRPIIYLAVAILTACLTALAFLPMLLTIHDQAGLAAYSANWTNSSFLFPGLRDTLSLISTDPNRLARYVIAGTLVALSLFLGFSKCGANITVPFALMGVSASFVLLSPTGYPWYFIWFLMFLPFSVQSWMARGLGLLTIGATAYYARFQLGEAGHYNFYSRLLLPLEFGIPLLFLAWDGWKAKQHA